MYFIIIALSASLLLNLLKNAKSAPFEPLFGSFELNRFE